MTLCILQEAVLKAAAAFAEASRFADEHSRAGALASLDQQFNISFVGVLERIKRRLLEKQLDYDKLLDKAKSQGLEALDWEGLSQEVTACHDEKAALEAVEVRQELGIPDVAALQSAKLPHALGPLRMADDRVPSALA